MPSPAVRKWIYSVALVLIPLLVFYGLISDDSASLWVALVGAILTPGLAIANVKPAEMPATNAHLPMPATNAHHKRGVTYSATAPDQGAVLSAVTDYANAVAAQKVADQKTADDQALATLNGDLAAVTAAFDAYKASHPDVPIPPVNPPPVDPPVDPPKATAVLGASLGQNLPAAQALPAVRYYRAPTWKGSELEAAYQKGTRVFVLSTKDATPANMVALVDSAPANVTFYVTTYHEPDDNIKGGTLTVATYGARMNAMGQALAGRSNVKFGPIHNGSYGRAAWVADAASCDKSLWSFWGMDRYSPKYETPTTQFKEGADYAKSLGLPLVIGECGADPANASSQKQLAAQIRAWSLDPANGAAVVCWWQQTGYTFASSDVQRAFLG